MEWLERANKIISIKLTAQVLKTVSSLRRAVFISWMDELVLWRLGRGLVGALGHG